LSLLEAFSNDFLKVANYLKNTNTVQHFFRIVTDLPPHTSASLPKSRSISIDFPANTTSKITGSKNSGAQCEAPVKEKPTETILLNKYY
jgi:hypothetical protein